MLSTLRRVLFWDTDMSKIDWRRQYRSVITRVFARGNEQEQQEIIRFYGKPLVDEVLSMKVDPDDTAV